jgi:hypothetical protein
MRPKMFAKLEAACAKGGEWVAALVGQFGPATPTGFVLTEPNLQVFERKPKPVVEASAPAGIPPPAPVP